MDNNLVVTLRKFFQISNAGFDASNAIVSAITGKKPEISPMHRLHRFALAEIEKDKPDMSKMDYFLAQMEGLADINRINHEHTKREANNTGD